MKKFLAVTITLAFLLAAALPPQAYAVGGLTFSAASNVSAARGGQVSVPIIVSNNPGFAFVGLAVTYDPNVLEIAGISAPVAAMPLNSQSTLTSTPGIQWVSLINTRAVNWDGNGTVASLTFNVKSTAPAGASAVALAFTSDPNGTPVNSAGRLLSGAAAVSGSVNIAVEGSGGSGSASQPDYRFIGGDVITVGSSSDLVKRIEKDFGLFESVSVNGRTLTQNIQYDVRSGSTVVTLYSEYLNTLPAGEHTWETFFTDGERVRRWFVLTAYAYQPSGGTGGIDGIGGIGATGGIDGTGGIEGIDGIGSVGSPGTASDTGSSAVDDGGFIGTPHTSDDTGIGGTAAARNFGRVPQTGVRDITGALMALIISFLTLATGLFVCVFCCIKGGIPVKKIFAMIITLSLMFTAGAMTQALAAEELTFTAGSGIAAEKGGTVTVPITVSNNPGFFAAGLVVTYDPSILEITGVTAPVEAMPLNPHFALTSEPGTQWIHLVNTDITDWNGNGVVANITFNVNPAATGGVSAVTLGFTDAPDGTPGNAAGDLLTGAVLVSGSVNIPGGAIPFADIREDAWYFADVVYVYTNSLMTGTSAALFSPDAPLTRGMVVTVLYRIAGSPDASGLDAPFSDAPAGRWYTDAVNWAAANGIVSGHGGGVFGPEGNITRQDLAVILARFLSFRSVTLPESREYQGFNDEAGISEYAKEAVGLLFKAEIISGRSGNVFDPMGTATRAEFAAMLRRGGF